MNAVQLLKPRKLRTLSLVFPIYNESEGLPHLRAALTTWMDALQQARPEVRIEAMLVDDGSDDDSLRQMIAWAEADERIRVLALSRNFGHQAACTAGLAEAGGDAVVVLDADLQDPLDVIHDMIARYEEGYDIAYGQRTERPGESRFKRTTAWLFYRIMRSFVYKDLPADTGGFRLVSRNCLDAVNALPEKHRFLRGLFAWSGFAQIAVPYERQVREYGSTKYPLYKMLSLAWNAITSFSTFPVRLISYAGMIIALFGLLFSLYAFTQYLRGDVITGWTTLACLISTLGGMILLGLGIIGEYVGRIYEEVQCRPVYIVRDRISKQGAAGSDRQPPA